jgi:hypothetical protein
VLALSAQPLRRGSLAVTKVILIIVLIIGFAAGYAVRELIGRRRRAAAREKYYQEHPELRRLRGPPSFC